MLLCDMPECANGYHAFCLKPPVDLSTFTCEAWHCPGCPPVEEDMGARRRKRRLVRHHATQRTAAVEAMHNLRQSMSAGV